GFDGEDPMEVHQRFAALLDRVFDEISAIKKRAKAGSADVPIRWPMIVFRTPKGWTGPKEIDGQPIENTWRSHQVPMSHVRGDEKNTRMLEEWMRSYHPDELFDGDGRIIDTIAANNPAGTRRM